ncbi:MAG: phosphoglycerate kinase [Candidatus Nanopelagicales bacterium]|nr:phosphoglycerate kinase [Candidatus Nanopelagicales bacterium]
MKKISDLDVAGKTVLLRADFNVPLAKDGSGVITDDGRIVASLPTIKALTEAGAKVVVVAHLGRPKGVGFEASGSLAPVAARLGELLGTEVKLAGDVTGESARATVAALQPGEVALLENIRFDGRETSKDEAQRKELAAELAAMADVYVSDGFGVVHRKQASVTDVAELLPNAAGLLVEKEVSSFSKVLANPDRPYVVILGGSKVSDKLGVIDNLIDNVDRLLIGGGMAYTFLAARGHAVGDSLLEADQIDAVKGYLAKAQEKGIELLIPVDTRVSVAFPSKDDPAPENKVVASSGIPDGWMGLDIGPETIALFASKVADARTVVWNGPMGVFEFDAFAAGTLEVAQAIAASGAFSVIGGGDSAAAVRKLGLEDGFSHISTGGGASLELLEGKTLPGLAVLEG